jgi:hypothetical protein
MTFFSFSPHSDAPQTARLILTAMGTPQPQTCSSSCHSLARHAKIESGVLMAMKKPGTELPEPG